MVGAVVYATGCSRDVPLHPVLGKVLHKSQPLSGATVIFHAASGDDTNGDFPVGQTEDDGRFVLTTGGRSGAPAGEYKVTIVCLEAPQPHSSKSGRLATGDDDPQDRLKGAYANPATSKLTAVVKSGTNQLEPFVLP